MFRSRPNLGFPRKVVAYYLLFCLVAIGWLTVGVLVTSHAILCSRTTSTCLSKLGKTAAAIEIEYLRHGTGNLQSLLESPQTSSGLAHSSIVSLDGTFLAHSNRNLVGERAVEPTGHRSRWGNVTGTQFVDQQGRILNEYRAPLIASNEPFGSLQIAVEQPSIGVTLRDTASMAPLAILVPLALVALGAIVLARLSRPMAEIDVQLRKIAASPPAAPLPLQPLRAKDALSLGWNRVIDSLESYRNNSTQDNLNDRLTESIAAQKQNELKDAFEHLTDGVAITDAEGRIIFANRAIAALLGAESSDVDLQGTEIEGHLIQDAADSALHCLFDVESIHRPAVAELQRSGEKSNRVLRVARQPLEGQRLRGHVWSVRDVTQQKLSEKMRDQFIDVATHELRTPLTNIKAYAETLATCKTIEVKQQREFCNTINSEVTRLARFVDDLLSISSMEVGSLRVERQKTETARLFEEVLSKVQPLMQQKEIHFEALLPEKMGDLQLDKDKIAAVLVNLLGNAAKYTPNGGRVSMRVKLDATNLQIAIEDTGVGIAEDELPKVFEKFFRSADSRVQAEIGSGLGLSLAREVVRMHGGDITVESQLDQGSTFVATIPLE